MAPSELSAFLAGDPASDDPPTADQNERPAGATAGGDSVLLNDRFEILTERPVNDLSSVTATAFSAIDARDRSADMVAYVCQTGLPPRWEILGGLRGLDSPVVVRIVDYGMADWAPDNARRPVIVTTRPKGAPIARSIKQRRTPMADDVAMRQVLQPLIQAISELKLRRTFHGCINPTNIFLREGDGATAKAMVGECVTAPPGFSQPLLFEPIERGLAMPVGRGAGTMADDIYATGVTLLFMVAGHLPMAQLDDRAIMSAKIEKGSFASLTADLRLSPGVSELLRGMLFDDPDSRWTTTDIEMWMDGRRQPNRQAFQPRRSSRPFTLGGQDCWTTRTLALQMSRQPDKAITALENGDVVHWLRRSLEEDQMVERLEEAERTARTGRGGTYEDRRLARSLTALDPLAPIRYKSRAVLPFGIGYALAEAYIRGSGAQEIAEIITAQLPLAWVNNQQDFQPEFAPLMTQLDQARGYLERPVLGNGLERVLYELNQSVHCMSPMVEAYHCLDLETLVHALEDVAGRPGRPREPFDRHIAAFILSRHSRIKDKVFTSLTADPNSAERGLACLSLMAELQRETRIRKLRNLSEWTVALIGPLLEQYNSRSLREKLRDHLEKEAKQGDLRKLLQVITNANLRKKDAAAFRVAARDHALISRQIQARESELADRDRLAADVGRQFAALCSGLLAAVMLVVIVLMNA